TALRVGYRVAFTQTNLGSLYAIYGKPSDAVAAFEGAQAAGGVDLPAMRRFALAYADLGRCADAERVLAKLDRARGLAGPSDEFVYVPAGYYHLKTGDLTFDSTNPPLLKMAMAAPLLAMDVRLDLDPRWRDNRTGWGAWIFGTRFMDVNRAHYLAAFFAARMV